MTIPRRQLGITLLLLWTLTVSVIRSIRFPNDFAEAHWLLDYRFGFVKRGLIGTLVSLAAGLLHRPITERLILTLSLAAFLVFCLTLIVLSLRIIRRSGWSTTTVLIALVFLSSPFVVMSANLVGYYDNIIIVLTVVSIALLLKGRIWLAACCQAVAILAHESSMLIGFPVFVLAALLLHSKSRRGVSSFPLLPLSVPVAAFVLVVAGQALFLPRDFNELLTAHLSRFEFIGEGRNTLMPMWLTTTFWRYFQAQKMVLAARLTSPAVFGFVLPSTMVFLCHIVHGHRIREISAQSLALLGACSAPQLMHLVAWDTPRILSYTILCSFLELWIYAELFAARPGTSALRLLCLAALVANVMALTPLLEEYTEHFALKTRLLLYAPMMAGVLALVLHEDRGAIRDRLTIRGSRDEAQGADR